MRSGMCFMVRRQSCLVKKQTGFDLNSGGWQVGNLRYSRLKIFITVLSAFGVFFSCAAAAQAKDALHEPRKSDSQEKPVSIFSIKGRPANITGKRLATVLFQKLTLDELPLVKNPLARTPEMNAWARQITAGDTNKLQKAKLLFDALVSRANPPRPGATRTAKEVFADWKTPSAAFCCEEYTSLYVALARAAGLEGYSVYVVQQETGATPRHACAAVFISGDELVLVDPTIPWFGVPHRQSLMMDDVQAIAAYLVQAPGLKQHRIAYKLAPELSVVQSNFYLSLISEGQSDEAKQVLEAMPRWNTEAWVTNFAQGAWALYQGNPAAAVPWLEKSIQTNPYVGVTRRMLGDALARQGKLHEARKVYIEGLSLLFDDFNLAQVHQAIFSINEYFADRAGLGPQTNSVGLEAQKEEAALRTEVEQDKDGANKGVAFAMRLLARRYERGNGVEKDGTQAVKWYKAAAQAGDADSIEDLGNLFFRGAVVEKDPAQTIAWWNKAAEAGNSEAMASLGKLYLGGYGVPEDQARAFEWFQRGANQGNVIALSSLGWMYTHGVGVAKNYAEGLVWLRKAADAQNGFAIHELGLMYLNGDGVDQNDRQAADWFQKGAEVGDAASMSDLGTLYVWGKGVPKDVALALTWFRKAAEAGNALAMFNLGSVYEENKDFTEAIDWYRLAEKAGYPEAAKKVESLANQTNQQYR
jgi:TPR repeat protein/transglutaminase-like putative cysteine protease